MRLPRVRFSVGMLLFAVAVVAVNCWAFGLYFEHCLYQTGATEHRILRAEIGLLPLANVALIGVCLVAARRIRSVRRGREADARPPSALAYFSVQFLALIGLFNHFMPDAVLFLRQGLHKVTEYAALGWTAVLGAPGDSVPWIIFQSAMLGVLLSGPPLLASWIGRSLARRCARTLPRRRFLAMAGLVSLDFAIAGLAVCVTPRPFEDVREIHLDFQVIDEDSGRPVVRAFVYLTDPVLSDFQSLLIEDPTTPRAFTDDDGRARLHAQFVVRGERNAFGIMGMFSPWGRWLEVAAEGRRTRRIPLTDVLGTDADPNSPPPGTVALARGEPPEDSFRDLAGTFISGGYGFGGASFTIEPDGRFAWSAWGCTFQTGEYGSLRRHGLEIEPVPIPHPGREISPFVTSRYRVVAWGDRLFLGLADDRELGDFCRMALGLPVSYGVYRRATDGDKPATGLPRLPMRVWGAFLADAAGDVAKGARLAFRSLVPGFLRPRGANGESPESGPEAPPLLPTTSEAVAARTR